MVDWSGTVRTHQFVLSYGVVGMVLSVQGCALSVGPSLDGSVPDVRLVRPTDDAVPTVVDAAAVVDVARDVQTGPVGVAEIALGNNHTCALMADTTVRCWGSNSEGQVGDGTMEWRLVPTAVPNLVGVTQIALGTGHTCALMADTTVRCWGADDEGQIGTGSFALLARIRVPTPVRGLVGVTQIALGDEHTCARMADATVRCWGSNELGEIGDGQGRVRYLSPFLVPGLVGVSGIVAEGRRTCARAADATAWCWGFDEGPVNWSPARIPNLTGVAEIAIGVRHTCARMTDATVRCWGENASGQLGDGTRTARSVPTPIPGLTGVAQIALGGFHSCARMMDATVRCWGANSWGQLGDGTRTERFVPTPIPGLTGVAQIAPGLHHSCARMVDATVRCWGDAGQVGDGTASLRNTPTPVL